MRGEIDERDNDGESVQRLWGNGISLPVLLPMFKAMRKVFEKDG